MPNASIVKASEVCNKPLKDVEELFTQAEKLAEEQGKKGNYAYIMGIFKKSLGKECVDKLGWGSSEIKEFESKHFEVLNLIQELKNLNNTIEENSSNVNKSIITSEMRKRICAYIWKKEYQFIQDRIKNNPDLKNDPVSFCNQIKIYEVEKNSSNQLIITFISGGYERKKSFWTKKEQRGEYNEFNYGYFGTHDCTVVCNLNATKFYELTING